MEIWSRLLGGSSQAKKTDNSPQQRLIRFKKVHDQLQLIWRRNNTSVKEVTPPEPLLHCLQNIRQLLQLEVQGPAPHLCARHVSTFHIYSTIAQLAAIHPDDDVIQEGLDIFKVLLDSEEGDFLKDRAFADAISGFISTISSSVLPVETEAAAIEVLFSIAAKLRLQSEIISTWFRPNKKGWAFKSEQQQGVKGKEEFPLFYMVLGYVYHDGRTGDFARTGLLYLIESAVHSPALEQWIIESDLATLMASGLGALYSQLNRKLVLDYDEGNVPSVLAFSHQPRPKTPNDAEKTTSSDFKAHLSTFLSYLVFWQDVLEHCSSPDIKQSLLDHFKFLFLQQLLYPSLIESSDRDGGSSVAVLTYLKCIIESIDHPELAELTFAYLLAIPEAKTEEKSTTRPTALARRRRSQSLVASLSQGQEKPLPDLFNLDDLVLGSLRSSNQQTVVATLRLICTMLKAHHRYDVSLIKMGGLTASHSLRTLAAHESNTGILYRMIDSITSNTDLKDNYESHLEDAQITLENHTCSLRLLDLSNAGHIPQGLSLSKSSTTDTTSTAFDDPILASLLALLDEFFMNEIDTNLSLTQAFSTIACCARRNLDDWLLEDISQETPTQDDYHTSPMLKPEKAMAAGLGPGDLPTIESVSMSIEGQADHCSQRPIFSTLDSLVGQVEAFRKEIEDFDVYLAERRHILKVGDDAENFVRNDPPITRRSEDSDHSSRTQLNNVARIGSISERLMPETSSNPSSSTNSPRGRQQQAPSTTALTNKLDCLRVSSSRSPKAGTRNISPSPLRQEVSSDSPQKQLGSTNGEANALSRKVKVKAKRHSEQNISDLRSDTSSLRSESVANETPVERYQVVTLSHILTNVIILQEFLLELVAIVQVRATLFGEVKFN